MSLENDLRELGRIPLFAAMEYEALRLIAFAGEARILRAGDVVFHKGDISDGGYVLLNGLLELESPLATGAPRAIVPPMLVGEMALLTETERPGTLIARSPSSVLRITRDLFQRVLREFPRSARQTRDFVESRLADYMRDITETGERRFLNPDIG
jgi:CRP-like cAMP-binding protein